MSDWKRFTASLCGSCWPWEQTESFKSKSNQISN